MLSSRMVVLGALAVIGSACGGGDGSRVTLNGSGSTFQKAAQEIAIEEFKAKDPTVTVNYGGGGSGKGRQDFADQVVDFACTDAPFKDADLKKVKGGEFFYIPDVLGAIAVAYHVEGVSTLQLSGPTLAKIFARTITRWNDPAIAADNAGVALPDATITVAHRSDGSGTTENFTKYLASAGGSAWTLGSGSTVEWSSETQAGNGNGGVAQIVKNTAGSIAYIDLSDAKAAGLTYASIKNAAGTFVEPTAASVSAAGEGVTMNDQLIFSALDSKVAAAYPITAQSWCMVYASAKDPAKAEALKAYFTFLVTDAQSALVEVDYAPISPAMRDAALAKLAKLGR